jgi:hypothetical protein
MPMIVPRHFFLEAEIQNVNKLVCAFKHIWSNYLCFYGDALKEYFNFLFGQRLKWLMIVMQLRPNSLFCRFMNLSQSLTHKAGLVTGWSFESNQNTCLIGLISWLNSSGHAMFNTPCCCCNIAFKGCVQSSPPRSNKIRNKGNFFRQTTNVFESVRFKLVNLTPTWWSTYLYVTW